MDLLVWSLIPIVAVSCALGSADLLLHGPRAKRRLDPNRPSSSVAHLARARRRAVRVALAFRTMTYALVLIAAVMLIPLAGVVVLSLAIWLGNKWELVGHVVYAGQTREMSTLFMPNTFGSYQFPDYQRRLSGSRVALLVGAWVTAVCVLAISTAGTRLGYHTALVFGGVPFFPTFRSRATFWTLVVPSLGIAGLAFVRTGERSARRRAMRSTVDLKRSTPPKVLYLRPFDIDARRVRAARGPRHVYHELWLPRSSDLFEDVVIWPLWAIGPVGAVTTPGTAGGAALGAVRWSPLGEGEWQPEVARLMDGAQLVVLVLSRSRGVQWELAQVRSRPEIACKTLVVIPPRRSPPRKRGVRLRAGQQAGGCALVAYWDGAQFRVLTSSAREDVDYEVAIEQGLMRIGLLQLPEGKSDLRLDLT